MSAQSRITIEEIERAAQPGAEPMFTQKHLQRCIRQLLEDREARDLEDREEQA